LKILRDNYSALKSAVDEAEARGREAGKLEAKLEIARNLKAAGLTLVKIKAATGLTDSELEGLWVFYGRKLKPSTRLEQQDSR
jgi:predicted transposase/invertase (TIGR01784 family)